MIWHTAKVYNIYSGREVTVTRIQAYREHIHPSHWWLPVDDVFSFIFMSSHAIYVTHRQRYAITILIEGNIHGTYIITRYPRSTPYHPPSCGFASASVPVLYLLKSPSLQPPRPPGGTISHHRDSGTQTNVLYYETLLFLTRTPTSSPHCMNALYNDVEKGLCRGPG